MLHDRHFDTLAKTLLIGIVAAVLWGMSTVAYRWNHVACPSCEGKTRTTKDATQRHWVARCQNCGIEWDLKISALGL